MNKLSDIVKDLSYHVLSTAIFAAAVYAATRSAGYACIVVIGGLLIDLDHLIDYFLYLEKFTVLHLVRGTFMKSGKVYLFLHSWEIIAAGLLASVLLGRYAAYLFFASLAMHLGIDNAQRGGLKFYFLLYRLSKRFDLRLIAPEFSRRFTGCDSNDDRDTQ
jgi:hypothetical protein